MGRGQFLLGGADRLGLFGARHVGHENHPRVLEGIRLLLDRASDEGGINYGNRRILGRTTEPIPGPTAMMLLALQGHGDEPRVAAAVQYLLRPVHGDDLEHLCWTKIALHTFRDQNGVAPVLPALDEAILRRPRAPAGNYLGSPRAAEASAHGSGAGRGPRQSL